MIIIISIIIYINKQKNLTWISANGGKLVWIIGVFDSKKLWFKILSTVPRRTLLKSWCSLTLFKSVLQSTNQCITILFISGVWQFDSLCVLSLPMTDSCQIVCWEPADGATDVGQPHSGPDSVLWIETWTRCNQHTHGGTLIYLPKKTTHLMKSDKWFQLQTVWTLSYEEQTDASA